MLTYRQFSRLGWRNCTRLLSESSSSCALPSTPYLNIKNPADDGKWPIFQVMDLNGIPLENSVTIDCDKETSLKMYRYMARVQVMDDILYNAQVCFSFL